MSLSKRKPSSLTFPDTRASFPSSQVFSMLRPHLASWAFGVRFFRCFFCFTAKKAIKSVSTSSLSVFWRVWMEIRLTWSVNLQAYRCSIWELRTFQSLKGMNKSSPYSLISHLSNAWTTRPESRRSWPYSWRSYSSVSSVKATKLVNGVQLTPKAT